MSAVNKQTLSREGSSAETRLGQSLLERIGNTPLLRVERVGGQFPNAEFYAKAEWFNPGGSVKDRAAYSICLLYTSRCV